MELGGWQPREGDAALAALLSIHSLAMSGGLLDAVERHSKEEIDRAVAGFRYFSLDDAAAVVVSIAQQVTVVDIDAEQLEAEANDRYAVAVPNDDSLAARFEQVFRERRDAFAPLE